jgi:beta-glucosidase
VSSIWATGLFSTAQITQANHTSHGLSYTTFSLSSLTVTATAARVTIKNTGSVAGAEIIQLYVSAPSSPTVRPQKELHGFQKVYLEAGEEKAVVVSIDKYAGSFWDEIENCWRLEKGIYEVLVGNSSQADGKWLKASFEVAKEKLWLGL